MNTTELFDKLERLGIKRHNPAQGLVYKYTDIDSAIKILNSATLKFSTPDSFNDPFELTDTLIDTSYTKEQLKKWINEEFAHMNNAERRKAYTRYVNKPTLFKQAVFGANKDFKDSICICCFSKSYLKTLMWSHYAQNHRGVCLGFSFPYLINTLDGQLLTVRYANEINPINFFSEKSLALYNWIFTKSHVWSYEEEIRALYLHKAGMVKYDRRCLKDVYFGVRTSKDDKEKIHSILREKGFCINKMTTLSIDKTRYDLTEKRQ